MVNYCAELHPAQRSSDENLLANAVHAICYLVYYSCLVIEDAIDLAELILIEVQQEHSQNHFDYLQSIHADVMSVAFAEKFEAVMWKYLADRTEAKYDVEQPSNGHQQRSGIDSASQTIGTVLAFVRAERHYAALQAHILLDYSCQSTETDQKHHYLSNAGLADFAASIGVVGVGIVAVVETDEAVAEIVDADEDGDCLSKKVKTGNSSSPSDPVVEALYGQLVVRAYSTDYL